MKKAILWTAVVVWAGSMSVGCTSRIIKEAAGAGLGASGITQVVSPAPASLDDYGTIRIEPFTDETGLAAPSSLNDLLASKFKATLAKKGIPTATTGAKTLTVRGQYIYYETASKATSQVFGPFEEVIARVQLLDGDRVIGKAVCVGRSKTTTTQGIGRKAEGLAKAIIDKWIAASYTLPEK